MICGCLVRVIWFMMVWVFCLYDVCVWKMFGVNLCSVVVLVK